MSETILSTPEHSELNPLELLKSFSQEKSKLQREVVINQPLITQFVDHIAQQYSAEEIESVTQGTDLKVFIKSQILDSSGIETGIHHLGSIVPGAKNLLSAYTEGKKMLADMTGMLGGESDLQSSIDAFIVLWKEKPFDIKKVEEWMVGNNISINGTLAPTQEKGQEENKNSPGVEEDNTSNANFNNEIVMNSSVLYPIIELAKSEIGANEKDNTADKYFYELGYTHDSKKVPWCGAFVSRVLMKSGFPIPKNNLSSKAFISEEGLGHVGIKVEDKIVSGNYGNKVSSNTIDEINKPIVGYAIPTSDGLEVHKENIKFEDIPEGAIVVFDRNGQWVQAA